MSDAPRAPDDREDELASLRCEYVEILRETVSVVTAALDSHDHAAIRTLAHQTRGAAGMYGFHEISGTAGALEDAIDEEQDEQVIRAHAAEFIRCVVAAISSHP